MISAETRIGYKTALTSFRFFCNPLCFSVWPATQIPLEECVTMHIFRNMIPKQREIQLQAVQSYLSGLIAYLIEQNYDISMYDPPRLQQILLECM